MDFGKPVGPYTFLLITGPTSENGSYRVSFTLEDESGGVIVASEPSVVQIKPSPKLNLVLGSSLIQFPGPGKYKFKLLADGSKQFETTLHALQAA